VFVQPHARRPRAVRFLPVLVLLSLAPGCTEPPPQAGSATGVDEVSAGETVVVARDVPVVMRDGVTLYANIYRPDGPGPFPALLMRTPYNKENETQSARLAMTDAGVARGYVVVVQNTRGHFGSEGRFVPYAQDRYDGYDTIEWVADLPYVNGRVGTFGLSYPGAVQWMAAAAAPPSLVAISPSQTFASHRHFFYHGGVFSTGMLRWLLARQYAERRELGLPITSGEELAEAWEEHGGEWLGFLPQAENPLMDAFPYWREWLENPIESDYWDIFDIEAQHDRITVPALNLTGWNDDSYGQPGAIRNYVGMTRRGATPEARNGQRLVIGPWTHGVPSDTRTVFRDVDYGPEATIDYVEFQLRFFDHWLKGIDDGFSDEAPVRIFVMGDNVWRDEDEWPLARTEYTDLYLRTGEELGWAGPTPDGDPPATFVYDPRAPASIPPEDEGSEVLTFTSPPFEEDTEVTGHILLEMWATSTAPDTDFTARLFEMDADGGLRRMTAAPGVLRARYRSTEDPQDPNPLPDGEPTRLTISLGYTSYVVPAGHRLRLFVTGSLSPNLHLNVWEPFRSMEQAQAATQALFMSPDHPSRIVLPIIPR
jgi:uncharacterized protein